MASKTKRRDCNTQAVAVSQSLLESCRDEFIVRGVPMIGSTVAMSLVYVRDAFRKGAIKIVDGRIVNVE